MSLKLSIGILKDDSIVDGSIYDSQLKRGTHAKNYFLRIPNFRIHSIGST